MLFTKLQTTTTITILILTKDTSVNINPIKDLLMKLIVEFRSGFYVKLVDIFLNILK